MPEAKDNAAVTKDAAKKEPLFPAGYYMNAQPRVLNLIATEQGGETRIVVPGRNVELTEEDTANKHIHHLIKHGELVPAESAEAKAARERDEAEQAKIEAKTADAGKK